MWKFLMTRVAQALLTLWVVSIVVFLSARLTGSPDLALLPPDALPEHRQAFKQAYGLDKPVLVQYWRWLSRAVQGDLGKGIQHKMAVSELIGPRWCIRSSLLPWLSPSLSAWLYPWES